MDPVTHYAHAVRDNKILTGIPVHQACDRHLRDLEQGEARGLIWKPEKVLRAIKFAAKLLCFENGKPFILEPFEEFIAGSLLGWYRKDGYRRFRTAYVELGKGSGKTAFGAYLGIVGLTID